MSQPRAATDDEFLSDFRDLVQRLDAHLAAVAEGKNYARHDLAVALRMMLVRGKGDSAMRRFITRFNARPPRVVLTPEPPTDSAVVFSFGALPAMGAGENLLYVSFPDEVIDARAVFIRGERSTYKVSWLDLITDYGNAGAHVSTTVTTLLDRTQFFGVSETSFGAYMLWGIGRATSVAAHELMIQKDPQHKARHQGAYFGNHYVDMGIYLRKGTTDDIRAHVARKNVGVGGPVLAVRSPVGQTLELRVSESGHLEFKVQSEGTGSFTATSTEPLPTAKPLR